MRRLPLLVLLLLLVVPAGASAAVFPGDPVDGPSPGLRLGDLDLARDGTGAVSWLRAGEVMVSRFVGGTFAPPEVLLGAPGSDAAVAAGNGGRLAVVYASAGVVYASVKPAGDQPWGAPVPLGTGGSPDVDMSINNTAYATWTGDGNVYVARLDRATSAWTVLPAPADLTLADTAGSASRRPRVAVSADGVGIIVWGEDGTDGRTHVIARKVFGTALSTSPQDLTLPAGGSADQPDVDAEDDSSFAWVTFRQTVDGQQRTFARRQRGTLFDDAVPIDGGNAATAPQIALSGRGEGLSTATGGVNGLGAVLRQDTFGPAFGIGPGPGTLLAPAMAENSDGIIAWAQPGGVALRAFDAGTPAADVPMTRPELGPVDLAGGLDADVDRADDGVVVWTQGSPAARSLVAGYTDRPPLAFAASSSSNWRNPSLAPLRWAAAFDLWGSPTYTVLVDGKPVGTTKETVFTPTVPLPEGTRRWRVIATDVRGQTRGTRTRTLRIDVTPPRLTVHVSRKGAVAKISWRAADVTRPRGSSGVNRVRIDFGDGASTVLVGQRGTVSHRYRRTSTLKVTALDSAQNRTDVERRITKR